MYYISGGEESKDPGDRVCQNVRPTARARVCVCIYTRILRFSRLGRRCGRTLSETERGEIIKSKIHIAFFHSDLLCLPTPAHTFRPSPISRPHTFRPIAGRRTRRTYFISLSASVRARPSREIGAKTVAQRYFIRSPYGPWRAPPPPGWRGLKTEETFPPNWPPPVLFWNRWQ